MRPLAIFTIVQHEPFFLAKWVEHYSIQVPPSDLFILHHVLEGDEDDWNPTSVLVDMNADADDAHYDDDAYDSGLLEVNVVPVHHDVSFNHKWLGDVVADFQHFLLRSYQWALFVEADEIVTVHPDLRRTPGETLADYVARPEINGRPCVRATGYEVVQQHRVEPPLARDRPWLAQRRYWYPSLNYSKSLLARVPLRWTVGFHTLESPIPLAGPAAVRQPDLLLIHLHKIDFSAALEKARENAARPWSHADLAAGFGRQNRIITEEDMDRFFAVSVDDHATPVALEPIPDAVRRLF